MMQLVTETPLLDHHHCQQLMATNQLNPQSLNHYQHDQNIEQQQTQQIQHQPPQPNLEDLTHNTSSNNITLPIDSAYNIAHPIATELRLAPESTDKLIQAETTASAQIFIAPQAVESLPLTANKSYPITTTTSSGNRRIGTSNMSIQPTSYTKNHLINNNGSASHLNSGLSTDELSMKRRREDLSRRPSYRKIFNDLTGLSGPLDPRTAPIGLGAPVAVNEANATGNRVSPQQPITTGRAPRPPTTSPSPQAMDLLSSVGATTSINLQDPSATNSQSPVSVVDLPTTAVQQHPTTSQPQHHHNIQTNHLTAPHLHPSSTQRHHLHHHHHHQPPQQQHQAHHVPQHEHQQQQAPHRPIHQIMTPTSPPITGSGSLSSGSGGGNGEEATKKRELRLQKNREAAKECRRKKKEYIKCLENRVAVLENQNKALIDELKTLKDLYCKSANE